MTNTDDTSLRWGIAADKPKTDEVRLIEYRVKPTQRFVVTRYYQTTAGSGVKTIGEYPSGETAYAVGYAMARQEHENMGWLPGDSRIQYPEDPSIVRADPIEAQPRNLDAKAAAPNFESRIKALITPPQPLKFFKVGDGSIARILTPDKRSLALEEYEVASSVGEYPVLAQVAGDILKISAQSDVNHIYVGYRHAVNRTVHSDHPTRVARWYTYIGIAGTKEPHFTV